MTTPIPQPPPYPLFGNIRDLDPQKPIESLARLAKEYGKSFQVYNLVTPSSISLLTCPFHQARFFNCHFSARLDTLSIQLSCWTSFATKSDFASPYQVHWSRSVMVLVTDFLLHTMESTTGKLRTGHWCQLLDLSVSTTCVRLNSPLMKSLVTHTAKMTKCMTSPLNWSRNGLA
jgi:hypothetical protein